MKKLILPLLLLSTSAFAEVLQLTDQNVARIETSSRKYKDTRVCFRNIEDVTTKITLRGGRVLTYNESSLSCQTKTGYDLAFTVAKIVNHTVDQENVITGQTCDSYNNCTYQFATKNVTYGVIVSIAENGVISQYTTTKEYKD